MKPKAIFDSDGEDESQTSLKINDRFAKSYTINKKREELAQLKERYGDDDNDDEDETESESDDEPEDEFGDLVTPQVDAQIMRTISMIRAKKDEVYDPSVTFFSEKDMEAAKRQWEQKANAIKAEGKPIHLKDYHRENLLNAATGAQDDENDDNAPPNHSSTHTQEQMSLKKAFKDAAQMDNDNDDGGDDADDLFTVRQRSIEEIQAEDAQYSQFLLENMDHPAVKGSEGLNGSTAMDENEAFLMDFVLNRGWIDKEAQRMPSYDQIVMETDEEEDEAAVDAADEFETRYNFRFEEEGASKIIGHARHIDGLLRRKDDKRKEKRQERNEKKAESKTRKEEELKRLKNLKRDEIRQKLQQIRDMAGGHDIALEEVDLEKEFDPNEYDATMARAFNDSYYNNEDPSVKPVFEDDLDIDDIVGPTNKNDPKLKKKLPEYDHYRGEGDDFIMDADYLPDGEHYDPTQEVEQGIKRKDKKKKKKDGEKEKMSYDEYLEEYYQLDYEDLIGDQPTRFKYRTVESHDFGLTPEEIFHAEDAELNQVISLKKLAPYRRAELVHTDLEKWNKKKKKRLYEFRSKLKARAFGSEWKGGMQEEEVDETDRKMEEKRMKRAGIDSARLEAYGGSKKQKKAHK